MVTRAGGRGTRWCRVGLLLAAWCGGCVDGGDSKFEAGVVLPSEAPFGPKVVFDALARPVPEVPLPNDLLLRSTQEGGVAWNVSEAAPTEMERKIRERLPRLDGFGTFAPISVRFDGPIDLDTVDADSVQVVDVTAGSAHRGERVELDFGEGAFPLKGGGRFWPFDPDQDLPDFLLGRDNDWPLGGETRRVSHYEVETSTLIVRPVVPLRPGARYAVLLTRDILGLDEVEGARRAIRSPFPFKAHAAQVGLVKEALELTGMSTEELAFGWTFLTADAEKPLLEVRAGLHGQGAFDALAARFPPTLGEIRDTGIDVDGNGEDYPLDARDHRFVLQGEYLDKILGVVIGLAPGFSVDFRYVDYVAFGSMPSPDVRQGGDDTFLARSDAPTTMVPWLIAVPKTTDKLKPPFPVVFYFHGTGSSRFEFLAVANNLARQGIATVAYDQVGHGPIVPDLKKLLTDQGLDPNAASVFLPFLASLIVPDRADEFEDLTFEEGYKKFSEIGFFRELAIIGRTVDTSGDGALTSSESFFFADPFMQCAAFQQDLVDFMQFVRVLRSFDPAKVPAAIADPKSAAPEVLMKSLQAGDFNADGVLDLGGPAVRIGTAGTSLGGMHALMAAAIEPEVTTASPIAAGGGLSDILLRSTLRQITRVIYLEVFGPLVIGCPDGAGGVWLSLNDESGACGRDLAEVSFAHVPTIGFGDRVRITDLVNGEVREHEVDADGEGFALAVPADKWDQLRVEVVGLGGVARQTAYVLTPYQGLALARNSPELRRFVAITQHALDRCDPIAFARSILVEPRDGQPKKSLLLENVIGDETVPISTGVALARAAGLLGDADASRRRVGQLEEAGVLEGAQYDVDDLVGNNPVEMPSFGPLPTVPSGPDGTGLSAIRFAFAKGRHEWVAGPTDGTEYAAHTMTRNRIALFHASGGTRIVDDICIADEACPLLDAAR